MAIGVLRNVVRGIATLYMAHIISLEKIHLGWIAYCLREFWFFFFRICVISIWNYSNFHWLYWIFITIHNRQYRFRCSVQGDHGHSSDSLTKGSISSFSARMALIRSTLVMWHGSSQFKRNLDKLENLTKLSRHVAY